MEAVSVKMWRKLGSSGFGRWIYSKILCFKAPFFGTIKPTVLRLENGACEIEMQQRRAVENHIGSIHAIALCNLVELTAGLLVDASIPQDMRWIPKSMSVNYLQKAKGKIVALAHLDAPLRSAAEPHSEFVQVKLTDEHQVVVLIATVEMWLSPRK